MGTCYDKLCHCRTCSSTQIRLPRQQTLVFIDSIKAASHIEIVHIDPDLDAAAWALLKTRPDKSWSLVDAASFVVMSERGIIEALTTDQHFVQAGFVRLLKQ